MAFQIDVDLPAYMAETSGAVRIEVRDADDDGTLLAGLELAIRYLWEISHPEEPGEALLSFASEIEVDSQGSGFEFDIADAEAYDGLIELALGRIVVGLQEAGVQDAVVTWPESEATQTATWEAMRSDVPSQFSAMAGQQPEAEPYAGWEPVQYAVVDPSEGLSTDRWQDLIASGAILVTPELLEALRPPIQPTTGAADAELVSGSWATCAPLPRPRVAFAAVVSLDGRIYAVGGGLDGVRHVDTYDPVADEWAQSPPMSVGRRHPGVASANGRIFVIGGYSSARYPLDAEAYDPVTEQWERIAPPPVDAEMTACTGPDGRIYALALSGGSATAFEVYDIRSDSWTVLERPNAQYDYCLHLILGSDDHLLVIGKGKSGSVVAEIYDAVQGIWLPVLPGTPGAAAASSQAKPTRPPARTRGRFGAAAGGDGVIYVAGGESAENSVEMYNPTDDKWHALPPCGVERILPATVVGEDGALFVIGNGRSPHGGAVERFDRDNYLAR